MPRMEDLGEKRIFVFGKGREFPFLRFLTFRLSLILFEQIQLLAYFYSKCIDHEHGPNIIRPPPDDYLLLVLFEPSTFPH